MSHGHLQVETFSLRELGDSARQRGRSKSHHWSEQEIQQHVPSTAPPQLTSTRTLRQGSKMWSPTALRPWVFVGFTLIYVAMFVGLELLCRVSQRNQGISTTTQDRHYYWTYGPTAVLTVVTSLYHRVDFRICQLQPWKLMLASAQPASTSILLDYISPSVMERVVLALKKKHFLILATTTILILLDAMTIISTGLFALQYEFLPQGTQLISKDRFNVTAESLTEINNVPFLSIVANAKLNMTYAPWTNDQYALQSIEPSDASLLNANTTVSGTTSLFSGQLSNCEHGFLYQANPAAGGLAGYNITLATQSYHCFLNGTVDDFFPKCEANGTVIGEVGYDPSITNNYVYFYYFRQLTCSRTLTEGETLGIVLGVAETDYLNLTFMLCKPTYQIAPASITVSPLSTSGLWGSNVTLDKPPMQEAGIISSETSTALTASLLSALRGDNLNLIYPDSPAANNFGGACTNGWNWWGSGFFYLLSVQQPYTDVPDFFEAKKLEDNSKRLFSVINAQTARASFLTTDYVESSNGTVLHSQPRLVVKVLTVRLMEAILIVLLVATIFVYIWRPHSVVSRDPSSIGGLTTIIAASSSMVSIFLSRTRVAERYLKDQIFYIDAGSSSHPDCSFGISVKNPNSEQHRDSETHDQHDRQGLLASSTCEPQDGRTPVKWWRPLAYSIPMIILVLLVPVILLVAVQVLLVISDRRQGLANVQTTGWWHYSWTWGPALVMTGSKLLFIQLDFSTRILQPYTRLQRGGIGSHKALLYTPISELTSSMFMKSINMKEPSLISAAILSLIAPLLTIAASGLLVPVSTPYTSTTSFSVFDSFQNSSVSISCPDTARVASTLIEAGALAYPPWTYADLVIPRINITTLSLSNSDVHYFQEGDSVSVELAARRSRTSCYNASILSTLATQDYVYHSVSVNLTVPDGCGWGSTGNTTSNVATVVSQLPYSLSGIFGTNQPTAYYIQDGSTLPGSCPSSVITYGLMVNGAITKLTALLCNATSFETVQTNVTFTMPDFLINSDLPPVPNESTVTDKFYTTVNSSGYISLNLTSNEPGPFDNGQPTAEQDWGSFMSTVLWSGNRSADELFDPSKLADAVSEVSAIFNAQCLGYNIRGASDSGPQTTVNGTYTSASRTRLVQNTISTRILQALLSTLLLCTIIIHSTTRKRRLLPYNPCSIAAVTKFLAGSALLAGEILPEMSEWSTEEELARLIRGHIFQLGWWRDGIFLQPVREHRSLDEMHDSLRYGIDIVGGSARGSRQQKDARVSSETPTETRETLLSDTPIQSVRMNTSIHENDSETWSLYHAISGSQTAP